jgi:D-alanine-D-alanine ligase
MARKIRVGILFGGRSAEHEVSLQSAKNIIDAIDTDKYEVVLIGIDKKGQWHLNEESRFLLPATESGLPALPETGENVALVPGKQDEQLVALSGQQKPGSLDVIFPVLHGPFGEDGTVQGLLKLANVAFVGAGVLGSAVGMDKDVMKRLLRDAGIPIARFILSSRYSSQEIDFGYARAQLGLPLFVKPATSAHRSAFIKSKIAKNSTARFVMHSVTTTRSDSGMHQGTRDRMFGARQRQSDRISPGRNFASP